MNIKKIIDRLENSASKHRLRKAVLVAFSLLCLGASAAVPDANMLMTRSITMNMGLPSNSVRCIVQDKNGYMWFGTDYGLCRYDGYTVQTIYNTKLIDQYVGALLPTDDGLLVGTSQGAYFLSFKTEQFELLDKELSAHVVHFSLDGNRNVWISTHGQGVFRYNLTSHECRNYPMKGNQGLVNCTLVDVNNQVWALCKQANRNHQFLLRLNKSTNQFDPFRLKDAGVQLSGMAMLANPDGSILVGTWQDGLYQVNADGTTEQIISPLSNAMHHIHQLYNDPNQKVLVGSDDGLVEYDFQKRNWRMMSELKGNSRSTNDRFVYSISSDREGGLWVGTYYGGVNYIPSSAFVSRFQTYYASQEGGVRGNVVGRFVEDASRRIWIATDDAGLDCFDPATNRFVDYPGKAQMGKYNVHALLAEGTSLWVGTYGAGLLRMDMGSGSVQDRKSVV